jgi:deoxyadenosine/deoxycytidine kinase
MSSAKPRICIVGPCAAGKTSLAQRLRDLGYPARQIVQEHSYVADMWKRLSRPEVLIYLEATYETCSARKNLSWTRQEYEEQIHRLRHARQHCHIFIRTDGIDPSAVLAAALQGLAGSASEAGAV